MTAPDPFKGLRGVMAGTMVLEAIVVGLSLFVVSRAEGTHGWPLAAVGVLAVLMVLSSGCFRFSWGLPFALGLQVLTLLGFFLSIPLGITGVLFSLVWAYLLWLRKDVTQRLAEGRLPSQQQD
ncbi:DUF4233 domain-containing protein [Kutzneria viridogrisea]|uniref:DUF4233 domain-containing protein n=2 Tax=Kutzneria TaxID=43356 RepID=A0ABR6BM35_9PSEU|nr:DUF4233 domain-containing protein [Kutzneria albida]AHH94963.1 putative membrane protein [Kutzneria albida DSM 43870]MBA8927682.1 hypothetical protein [Kutzneria viridogrisea]